LRWGTRAETAWEQAADNRGKQKMLTTIRSTTNTKNKFLCLIAIVSLGVANMWLSGCAGVVSSANPNKTGGNSTPLTISNAAATSATMNSIQVGWTTSAPATSQVNYGKTVSYGSTTGVNSTMVSAHQTGIVSLTPGTTYHFQVSSTDGNGNSATSNDMTFTTLTDTTPPTVAIVIPAAGATISGTAVILSATATDNVGVASVQFKVDSASTGSPVTVAPYTYTLNTTTLSNGNHILTAVATDTSGNSATSAAVAVVVNNTTKDTTPPTVSMTAPANGATVSNTVTVSATASDNVAVASVQFQLDNANVGTAILIAPYTYSWDTTKSTNGTHTLRAIATDTSSNSTTSASVTVTVNNTTKDTTPPTVSMTAPANGATVSNTVTVSANASDNVAVASVQFQLDNANIGAADTVAPYTYSWDTTKSTNGSHTLRAIATDTSNNSTTSASVTVTVNNSTKDTTPPTVPTGLTATAASSSQISLSWNASTDNVGVTGYQIYRNGAKLTTSASTSYLDSGLAASTSYTYTVAAFDAAGNNSAQSAGASATTQAAGSGGGIPTTLGWFQIPNSQLAPNCPSETTFNISGSCDAVISAWSGGIADTTRNRLVVWGGGHTDYSGNELYALDLNALTMTRLNNPSSAATTCVAADADGNPNARHTYDGMVYLPGTDELFAFNGSLACSLGATAAPPDSWTNNQATLKWTQQQYAGTSPGNLGGGTGFGDTADYDPNTQLVFATDPTGLFSYNRTSNTWASLSKYSHDYHMTAVVDPGRKLFILFGGTAAGDDGGPGGIQVVNIASGSSYSFQDWNAQVSGCSALQNANYPGLAYDSVQKLIVGWTGGNTVYLFNPDTMTCTSQTYTGGPAAAQANGTFGRFRYFPALNVFAVVNDWQQNGYTLRLTAAPGGTGGGPAITGITVNGITMTGAMVGWTTDVAATSQVEYGTTTSYGTLTTLNATLVTSHSVALTGLTAGTAYHYRVHSKNSSGVESISGDSVFSTNSTTDTTPPTVSITAPAANATVSGTVTVSATASDNVGVTSVQFLLDGANLGSALATAPYSLSWDTTTASNGTHALSAQASDAAGNVGTATSVSVTVSNTTTASNSFQSRCQATGVILCNGLDTAANIGTIEPDCNGAIQGSLDTTVAGLEGTGALKFNVPANAGCANMSGYVSYNFGQLFSQNSDFYVQYRWRADANYLNSQFNSSEGFKQSITYMGGQSTCAQVEITIVNGYARGYPQAYADCGANGFCVAYTTGSGCAMEGDTSLPANDFLYEEGSSLGVADYNCYRNAPPSGVLSGCANYVANNWMTIYYHVHVGTYGSANSTVQMWVAYEGQPLQQFINMQNITLQNNSLNTDGYSAVELTNYNTDTAASTNPQGTVWYDSLIVSTQPIPAPNGPTP
jgi:hypothetical protein